MKLNAIKTVLVSFFLLFFLPLSANASGFSATLIVTGPYGLSEDVTYEATFTNVSAGDSFDSGGHEFTAPLPPGITLKPNLSTATSGVVDYDADADAVVWDGDLATGQSVTIKFVVTINATASGTISVQGTAGFSGFDGADGDFAPTDDPRLPGDADPTNFVVGTMPVTLQLFEVE